MTPDMIDEVGPRNGTASLMRSKDTDAGHIAPLPYDGAAPRETEQPPVPKLLIKNLCFHYGRHKALNSVNMTIHDRRVTAIIGPSGCGKSTLLRTMNRIYELYPDQRAEGEILMDGRNILEPSINLSHLRSRIGMVFQRPTPFPMSIYDNIAFGVQLYRRVPKAELDHLVEAALTKAALWKEVKDKLKVVGSGLSGGQQQRLCIARTIALNPDVLLLDEPASALDPVSTEKIEQLIDELRADYTIIIVTHNLQQAARVSDFTALMHLGELVEFGETQTIFTRPTDRRTEDYVTGKYG